MAVSFSSDIAPLFNQFTGQMMWRFDLTNYDQVRANAQTIYGRINGGTPACGRIRTLRLVPCSSRTHDPE